MNNSKKSIAVIGSGAWGTAIAKVASVNASGVIIISQNQDVIDDINHYSENKLYLPDISLSGNITASDDITMTDNVDVIFIAVPSQYVRAIFTHLRDAKIKSPVVICSKGIEKESLMLMSEVAHEVIPDNKVAILSGPNLAMEVALHKPSATTIASNDSGLAYLASSIVRNENFTPYTCNDMITNQIAGATKNIIAIASGLIIGRDLGENARAAVITKGISEIAKLSVAKGGKPETIFGYGGIGDVLLTCNSVKSRNTSLGIELAQNHGLANILGHRVTVAEGVDSAKSVSELAHKLKINMPICRAINDLLYNNLSIDKAISDIIKAYD
jgi:glycerol-3-phosphate dehydrogenase (NAD(P)+)